MAESAEGPVGPDNDDRMGDKLEGNFAQAREDVCQFVEFDLFSSQSPSRDVCGSELLSYRLRGTRELRWERTSLRIAEQ